MKKLIHEQYMLIGCCTFFGLIVVCYILGLPLAIVGTILSKRGTVASIFVFLAFSCISMVINILVGGSLILIICTIIYCCCIKLCKKKNKKEQYKELEEEEELNEKHIIKDD